MENSNLENPQENSTFSPRQSTFNLRDLVFAAFLLAVIVLFASTPLGFIRIGPAALTIIHIPVIVGSIILGPRYGAFLGFAFGMASLLNATFLPDAAAFAFSPFYSVGEFSGNAWSLVVCFVPRILVGITPYYTFKLLNKLLKFKGKESISLTISGIIGSLTNTIFVLGFIYIFFAKDFAKLVGTSANLLYKFLLTLIATNGLPEAILAAVLTTTICGAIMIVKKVAYPRK